MASKAYGLNLKVCVTDTAIKHGTATKVSSVPAQACAQDNLGLDLVHRCAKPH